MSDAATDLMAQQTASWEDRVVLAEAETAKALTECAALRAELGVRDERLTALEAVIATQKQVETDRAAAEAAAYVTELQAAATKIQQPIGADDLAKVTALMDAGHTSAARDLGDTYLLLAQTKAGAAGIKLDAEPLGAEPPADHKAQSADLAASMLQSMGIKAEAKDGVITTQPKRINL